MPAISITADAALDIVRQLAGGDLEVHGILLRDVAGKKFRYILRGFENIPADIGKLPDLAPLEPLRVALNATQLLQIVSVAQNAAIAASLRRIEGRLDAIERRLIGVEGRLTRLQTTANLMLAGMRSSPVNRLKAAKTAAVTAFRRGDTTALIAAAQSAEHAARDILDQAQHLVRIEEDGLPVALLLPGEHQDILSSAADAMLAASAMLLALDRPDAAAQLIHDTADAIELMRSRLSNRLRDPELFLRRAKADFPPDADLLAAARMHRDTLLWCRGRAVMIEMGLIGPDLERIEFEKVFPQEGIALLSLDTLSADPERLHARAGFGP